jgi:hypothetical protein
MLYNVLGCLAMNAVISFLALGLAFVLEGSSVIDLGCAARSYVTLRTSTLR